MGLKPSKGQRRDQSGSVESPIFFALAPRTQRAGPTGRPTCRPFCFPEVRATCRVGGQAPRLSRRWTALPQRRDREGIGAGLPVYSQLLQIRYGATQQLTDLCTARKPLRRGAFRDFAGEQADGTAIAMSPVRSRRLNRIASVAPASSSGPARASTAGHEPRAGRCPRERRTGLLVGETLEVSRRNDLTVLR